MRQRLKVLSFAATVSLIAGCSKSGPDLNSLPATFIGTLRVEPAGRNTKALYSALMALGEAHGMSSMGDGATDGHQWQVRIFCGKNYVGGATTAGEGELVLFQGLPYAFMDWEGYLRFKSDTLALMRTFGTVSGQQDTPPLQRDDLLARGKHMDMDVTSQCAPKGPAKPTQIHDKPPAVR